jgi:5-oxoprolinase (ATP-hydrolysing) subunit A
MPSHSGQAEGATAVASARIEINVDMGEDFALYRLGDDQRIAPHVQLANVACGFHASDPVIMSRTVRLAKDHMVKVGAHPSLPDREGFGRREMKLSPEELRDAFIYQIGALKGFLDLHGVPLNHVKPHGIVYLMAARDAALASAMCEAAEAFHVPLFGIAGTETQRVARERGLPFLCEYFADLEYDDRGGLIITRAKPFDPERAATRLARALEEGVVETIGGHRVPIEFQTVCVHLDTPNVVEIAQALNRVLDAHQTH